MILYVCSPWSYFTCKPKKFSGVWKMFFSALQDMGMSENSVPLNPMVNDHYPYFMGIYPTFSDKPIWPSMAHEDCSSEIAAILKVMRCRVRTLALGPRSGTVPPGRCENLWCPAPDLRMKKSGQYLYNILYYIYIYSTSYIHTCVYIYNYIYIYIIYILYKYIYIYVYIHHILSTLKIEKSWTDYRL